ncbi:protein kinase [Rhodococcus sp. NPDC057014]|uniref:protein kinase domain-containing protein n=1 Tax=Rhodococcus sp. NPDC057014 TaxID=3346000 RepID=UPI00363D03B0
MAELDPLKTQQEVQVPVAAELKAAGFSNAQEIGRGGFGVVYRCKQRALDRTVAIKILTSDVDEGNEKRFVREQRAMGRLTGQSGIVNILEVGTTVSGRRYIVMPYYPQGSLDARIRRHGPLTTDETLKIGALVAAALEKAHRVGVLHRDVKPSNILLTEYGEPALSDFGIAHISGGFETASGVVTGSPAFIAPEVLAGQEASPAADVYSLGATLFCALTGHAPFERRSGERLVAQFLRMATHPPPHLNLADEVSVVIERTMSPDPNERPSASESARLLSAQVVQILPERKSAPLTIPDGEQSPNSNAMLPLVTSYRRSTKGNLPIELSSFIGRRNELTRANQLITTSRLVSLTGIGGVGKTRLALQAAAKASRTFADGVWFVGLGELRDESLLVDLVTGALGIRNQSGRPTDEVLLEFLGSRQLLLVLDNCEQIVSATAKLAESLLRTCPELRILTTSREALTVAGEAVLRVPPLTTPSSDGIHSASSLPQFDAVRLFVDRAAAAHPDFELTEENQATVTKICQRLDGLPLAIELAAARLRAMAPEQILNRLTNRFTLLTRGARNAPTRQQALQLSIDWSYDLCSPLEQLVWSRLSIFAGSFELDAAEDICGYDLDSSDLLDVVASLFDKSILIRENSEQVARFRMLETIRSYGREKANQLGEHHELRARHRDWYQKLTVDAERAWITPNQLEWISRIDREQPNLREAMEFCLTDHPNTGLRMASALFVFWNTRSLFDEGRHWLDRLLAIQPSDPTIERAKALWADSVLAALQGDLVATGALVQEGRALAELSHDRVMSSLVEHADGLHAMFSGDLTLACSRLEGSVESFTSPDDLIFRVEALMSLGLAYTWQEAFERAISAFEEVLTLTQSRGESVFQAFALWAIGVAYWRGGNRDRATTQLEQGLRLARVANDKVGSASCMEALAWIAGDRGETYRAAVLMAAADNVSHAVGSSSVYLPGLPACHTGCERQVRRTLGVRKFDVARQEGIKMSYAGAIAYALGERPSSEAKKREESILTRRELEVAGLVGQGLTNKAIAAELVISPRTAQGHVEHILTKLGFTSRAQIAAWVTERGRGETRP